MFSLQFWPFFFCACFASPHQQSTSFSYHSIFLPLYLFFSGQWEWAEEPALQAAFDGGLCPCLEFWQWGHICVALTSTLVVDGINWYLWHPPKCACCQIQFLTRAYVTGFGTTMFMYSGPITLVSWKPPLQHYHHLPLSQRYVSQHKLLAVSFPLSGSFSTLAAV